MSQVNVPPSVDQLVDPPAAGPLIVQVGYSSGAMARIVSTAGRTMGNDVVDLASTSAPLQALSSPSEVTHCAAVSVITPI